MRKGNNGERQEIVVLGQARLHCCRRRIVPGREQGSLTSDLLELNFFTFFSSLYRLISLHPYALSKSHSWKPFLFWSIETLWTQHSSNINFYIVYVFTGSSTDPYEISPSYLEPPNLERFRHSQICHSSPRGLTSPRGLICSIICFSFLETPVRLSGWKCDYKPRLGERAKCAVYILMPWRRWACHFLQHVCKGNYLRKRTDWCRKFGYCPHLLL